MFKTLLTASELGFIPALALRAVVDSVCLPAAVDWVLCNNTNL